MKNLDLNGFGVQEMNAKGQKEINGGFLWFVAGAAAYVAWDIVMNPGSSCKEFMDGYNSRNRY